MANEEHLAILRQGVEVWNAWREANYDVTPNLQEATLIGMNLHKVYLQGAHLHRIHLEEADLQRAYLQGAHLQGAYLQGAHLQRAYLETAILQEAHLQKARLEGTHLQGAYLEGAYLEGAIFHRASLEGADLGGARLEGADFQDVVLSGTIFANNDLSSVIGLETVKHSGPSRIDIGTLYKSRGKIPEVFLRGCGVPDSLIEYLPSLIGATQSIQFYSCFISYSNKDEAFAQRLHSRMQQEHLRVWFAPEELKGGHKLRDQIDDAIRIYDKLLLILSDASMASD